MSEPKPEPKTWADFVGDEERKWMRGFLRFEWICEHISFRLGKWAFIEVLEYIGKLSLLGALIAFAVGYPEKKRQERESAEAATRTADDARKSRHYVAWQTINSAIGKPGDGGRGQALQDLARDGIPLDGVDLSGGAFLFGTKLTNVSMAYVNFEGAKLYGVNFSNSTLERVNFRGINCDTGHFQYAFLSGSFSNAYFRECDFASAQFRIPRLSKAEFARCNFSFSDCVRGNWTNKTFVGCNFAFAKFLGLRFDPNSTILVDCNFYPETNYPTALLAWARQQEGYVSTNITDHNEWLGFLRRKRDADSQEELLKMVEEERKTVEEERKKLLQENK